MAIDEQEANAVVGSSCEEASQQERTIAADDRGKYSSSRIASTASRTRVIIATNPNGR